MKKLLFLMLAILNVSDIYSQEIISITNASLVFLDRCHEQKVNPACFVQVVRSSTPFFFDGVIDRLDNKKNITTINLPIPENVIIPNLCGNYTSEKMNLTTDPQDGTNFYIMWPTFLITNESIFTFNSTADNGNPGVTGTDIGRSCAPKPQNQRACAQLEAHFNFEISYPQSSSIQISGRIGNEGIPAILPYEIVINDFHVPGTTTRTGEWSTTIEGLSPTKTYVVQLNFSPVWGTHPFGKFNLQISFPDNLSQLVCDECDFQ